jgi:RNA polymerase sigma factor (sigma-70 family)
MLVEQIGCTEERLRFTAESTDALLVQGCLAGLEAAWEHLFARYNRLIYKVPTSFGFPKLEVEEIYQEIAIEIIRCLPTLQLSERLHPWIVTIARRVCIRRLRSATKYTTVDVELLENEIERDVDTLEDLLIRLEEYNLIRQALAELEPRCRTLLTELFLREGQSHAAVAAALNMPLGSIGPTRGRCLEKLRERVEALSVQ